MKAKKEAYVITVTAMWVDRTETRIFGVADDVETADRTVDFLRNVWYDQTEDAERVTGLSFEKLTTGGWMEWLERRFGIKTTEFPESVAAHWSGPWPVLEEQE